MPPENQRVPSEFTSRQDDLVLTASDLIDDIASVNNETWSNYYKETVSSISIRDKYFNELLDTFCKDYQERSADKRKMKRRFCYGVLAVFILLIVSTIALPLILGWFDKLNNITFISSAITSLSGTVSGILILPQVIAKYLFDPQEDKRFIELIKNMQEYNTRGHERLEVHNNE